jgi:hypothetical protein
MNVGSSIMKNLKGSRILDTKNNAIIHNRFILYFIFFIALADLYYLTVAGDFVSVAVFILIGFLTSFFSKNMMIIFFIALTVTNILKYGTKIRQPSEGFEQSPAADVEDADESDESNSPHAAEVDVSTDKKEKKVTATKYDKNKLTNKDTILKPTEKVNTKEILSKLNKIVEIMKN